MKQIGMFDEEKRLEKLSKLGDTLEKLNGAVDWEEFRPLLNHAFKQAPKGAGGRPPYDYVMMFKILVLQRVYNLSDEQTEFQINDRMSFMRFVGLNMCDRVPDAKTIWLFRDTLARRNVIKDLFKQFEGKLEKENLITRTGTIIDATFVDAPRQHIDKEHYQQIKDGEVPPEWQEPEKASMLRQKDLDARYKTKGRERHYGYKDHVKVDADSKLITDYEATDAAVNDIVGLSMIDENDQVIYADSAYYMLPQNAPIPPSVNNQIHEKAQRKHPLTLEQKANNQRKSKIRCRIEHVFGFMTGVFHGLTLRSIGLARAQLNIGLTNLLYNIFRYQFLQRARSAAC